MSANSIYLEAACEAGEWLESLAVRSGDIVRWPRSPYYEVHRQRFGLDLYRGAAGIVPFLLELHRTTGKQSYLDDAVGASRAVREFNAHTMQFGLYTGLAGWAMVLARLYKYTEDRTFLLAARSVLDRLLDAALERGDGVEWDSVADVMSGAAGIGLALLELSALLAIPRALACAIRVGRRLLELANQDAPSGGLRWRKRPDADCEMPNFSHGTAGISYFLARLAGYSEEKAFLGAAISGARYLLSIAQSDDNALRICANLPKQFDVFYLGWCHGPAGSSRLFHALWRETGQPIWSDAFWRLNEPIFSSGLPANLNSGIWNKISRCCGKVSVAEHLLDLHHLGETRSQGLAAALTNDMLERGRTRSRGSRWWEQPGMKPEHPPLFAETGLMQGVAGMGLWLLRLYRFLDGKPEYAFRLPDSSFESFDWNQREAEAHRCANACALSRHRRQ